MGSMTGLAAFGFWMFIAAVVVSGIWSDIRKRESQQETLRRVVESGQHLDAALVEKMLGSVKGSSNADRDLKVGGIITMSVAPGLAILGYFLSQEDPRAQQVFFGIALLVGIIGLGIYVAGVMAARWRKQDEGQDRHRA
jgi:hypothetical protein